MLGIKLAQHLYSNIFHHLMLPNCPVEQSFPNLSRPRAPQTALASGEGPLLSILRYVSTLACGAGHYEIILYDSCSHFLKPPPSSLGGSQSHFKNHCCRAQG